MSASLSALIPALRPYARQLLLVAGNNGLQPRITSTRRSHTEQARLYRRFLAGQKPYPVPPPGQSARESGYALERMIKAACPRLVLISLSNLGAGSAGCGGAWSARLQG